MEVDLDNPEIDMTSILISASTSTSEVKNLKQLISNFYLIFDLTLGEDLTE